MRRSTHPTAAFATSIPFVVRHRRRFSAFALACFTLTSSGLALAGGYVDGNVVLNPAKAIPTGGVSVTPTFNNDQFNDRLLVGTVNNDPVRTPSTADPVSTVSGNNYHDETDFVIRGRNGLDYVFTRTYNSAPSSTAKLGPIGYGWTHSYAMQLKSNDFGDCPNCDSAQRPENANGKTSSITYLDERGGEQAFLVNEATYAVGNPKGVYDTLTLDSPAAGQHTLTFRNGVKYVFETPTGSLKTTPGIVARLKYIDNAWGDRLTLSYDAGGRLASLTDNLSLAGRSGLNFGYIGATDQLQTVTDWTGRQWYFCRNAANNLECVVRPNGTRINYVYAAGNPRLSEIVQPLARAGQAVKTVFKYYQNGRTFQQTNSLGQGDTLDYDLYRKSTRVTDARGFVREYFYDDNGRMTKLVEPDGGVLLFENQGDAIRSKKYDAQGYATTYSYRADMAFTGTSDAAGNVTREQDALNRTVDMSYGPFDQIASVKDKRGTITTTTYAAGTSGCDYLNRPKETRVSSLNGATNVLLASQCWNGDATLNYSRSYLDATRYQETRLSYEAGSNGLNVSQQQSVGMPSGITVTRTFTYDSLGRKKTETLQRRASPTDPALINLTTSYDYDTLDRVVKVTDALGNEVINSYDANGQLWKVTHRYKKPDATYDVRDIVTRTYDAADRVKTETDAAGGVTNYQYDPVGNVIAVTDAEGHTTRFEYDAMNRKTAVIDATGYRSETRYTLRGDVVSITNANDETVKFETDALGRKTAQINPEGQRSEYGYDENGNLVCSIDANASAGLQPKNTQTPACTETRQYDELNRVTRIIDAQNGETVFTYDLAGNRLTVQDAENKTWAFAYDDLGRLQSETDHAGKLTRYQADEAGNVWEKTNRLSEITRTTFDPANRATRIDYLKDGTAETFGYDAAGNRNAAANSSVSYAFTYDRLNRLTQKTDSRGKNLAFTYDKVGNILSKTTFQGSTTRYVYNAANRLVMLVNPDYTQVDYQYDPAGRLLSRVTANGARTTYEYDTNGGLTRLAQFDAANTVISDVSYTRDRTGNLLTQTDAAGGTTYSYDPLYRLKSADYPGSTNDELYTYDKVGNRKTYTKGSLTANADTRYYTYTAGTNRLADIRIGSAVGTLESSFSHDLEGRLSTQRGSAPRPWVGDAKGRVASLSQGGSAAYRYIRAAKLSGYFFIAELRVIAQGVNLALNRPSSASSIWADSCAAAKANDGSDNALDSCGGWSPSGSDAQPWWQVDLGQAVSIERLELVTRQNCCDNPETRQNFEIRASNDASFASYTVLGSQGSTPLPFQATWSQNLGLGEAYVYDPSDYRIERSGGALGSLGYFLEGEHLESVYDAGGLKERYLRGVGPDELVAGYLKDSDGKLKPFLFHHDHVNSLSAVSGHNGGTLLATTYSAFGNTQSSTGTSPNRLKYTGREDDGTGLYYYRARYYDPTIGRFISEDPLGFAAGDVNFYAYVGNNPINANDPSGMNPLSIAKWAEKLIAQGITDAKALIARRPWRLDERQAIENAAQRGPNGGFVCPGCKNEVPKLDINHIDKWGNQQREILTQLENGKPMARQQVRDSTGKI